MPTWWCGTFYGVYLGGTLKTPGVERVPPRWWDAFPVSSAWARADLSDYVKPMGTW